MRHIPRNKSKGGCLTSGLLKEPDGRLNPALEVLNMELLVRCVQIVVGQVEAIITLGIWSSPRNRSNVFPSISLRVEIPEDA